MKVKEEQKINELKSFRDLVKIYREDFGNKVAFKYKKDVTAKSPEYIHVSYAKFANDIKYLGTKLLDLGLENTKVAIIGPNRYEWCVSYLAVTTSNMTVVPLDKSLPDNEIKNLIKRSKAETILFDSKYQKVFDEIKKENNTMLKNYFCMDNEYEQLIVDGKILIKNGNTKYDKIKLNPSDISILLFTSGTTSSAKGVLLSQKNICSNINAIAKHIYVDKNDTLLSFLPLHHTFESSITFLFGTSRGVTIAFCDGLKYIAQNLKEYNITVFVCVPLMLETMYKKILKSIEKQGKTDLVNTMTAFSNALLKLNIDIRRKVFKSILENIGKDLRMVVSGAAAISKETIVGFESFGITVIQGYGLTETSPVASAESFSKKRVGSVGIPLKGVEIKIDNPNEQGVGEVIIKGPNVMHGYYENQEATDEVLKGKWFYTGDLGCIDKDGFLFIKGRKKTVIVLKNGKNIFPEEIETLVNLKPYVKESMVFGRLQDDGDYKLGVKVVYDTEVLKQDIFKEQTNISEEEIYKLINSDIKEINKTMPPYKYLREIIITEEPLIKTTTQKIKRFEEMKLIEKNKNF